MRDLSECLTTLLILIWSGAFFVGVMLFVAVLRWGGFMLFAGLLAFAIWLAAQSGVGA